MYILTLNRKMARRSRNNIVWLGVLFLAALLMDSKVLHVSGKLQIGINLGLMGDNLSDIGTTVGVLSNLNAGAVRLYDANPEILNALANRPHDVIVSVRNDQLADIATSPDAAGHWSRSAEIDRFRAFISGPPALLIYMLTINRSMARRSHNNIVWLGVLFLVALLMDSKVLHVSGKLQIGINLGLMGDNLPDIATTVGVLSNLNAGAVRLYDANPEILNALANRPHDVIVSVRNDQLADIATSPDAADAWVQANVVTFYPATKITFIAVGNEVLREGNIETDGQYLIQALTNIHGALESRNLHDAIKVVSHLSGEILGVSWPPATAFFDRLQYVVPLLQFLQDTGSTFFINLYPYYAHIANNVAVPFEFAAFQETSPAFTDPVSNMPYTNLFESMLDAAYNAMAVLGFPNLPLVVGETGWPTAGGHAATMQNAAIFNKNLIQHVYSKGTPQRPHIRTPVFIFSLFNENLKPGPASEQYWGLLNCNGTPVYPIDLADPTLAPDATTLPLLAATPSDGAFSVNPTIDLVDTRVVAAVSGDNTPVVNPFKVADPAGLLEGPTFPFLSAAPSDGAFSVSPAIDLVNSRVRAAASADNAQVENPFEVADPAGLPEGPTLPLLEAAPAVATPANPIDLPDQPPVVLDRPTLPLAAAADHATPINAVNITHPSAAVSDLVSSLPAVPAIPSPVLNLSAIFCGPSSPLSEALLHPNATFHRNFFDYLWRLILNATMSKGRAAEAATTPGVRG